MVEIRYPFTLYAKGTKEQGALKKYFDPMALTELRDLRCLYVTPILDRPIPMEAVVKAMPLIETISSSYFVHLNQMVRHELHEQEKAAHMKQVAAARSAALNASFKAKTP